MSVEQNVLNRPSAPLPPPRNHRLNVFSDGGEQKKEKPCATLRIRELHAVSHPLPMPPHPISQPPFFGEVYWKFSGEYWPMRERVGNELGRWEGLEPIYDLCL